MRRPIRFLTTGTIFSLFIAAQTATAAPITILQDRDASIAHDQNAGTWILSAGGATLTLAVDGSRDLAITSFVTPSGVDLASAAAADSTLRIGNKALAVGSRAAGFTLHGATAGSLNGKLELDVAYDLTMSGLRITRHYAIVSGSPTFEAWTSYRADAGTTIADLNALRLTIPAGTIHWVAGLQGDNADVESAGAFTRQQKSLAVGETMGLGAQGRSSEQTVPWFAVDSATDEFYGALMWSGAWSLSMTRNPGGLAITMGLTPMSTAVSGSVDGPHVAFGAAAGGLVEATAALRAFVLNGVRGSRPLTPLVTYNTWFAYGTDIDEPSLEAEMDRVAPLGVELFVVDAGWYAGAGSGGTFDFESGLGSWAADPARFPNGLAPLRDHARSLGMKFGIWVEPERVNLSLVGDSGVDESWLAMAGGSYESETTGLICLSVPAARQYLLDQLTTLIDTVQPDYVKWDNNMWVNCDREGHGHGATDGNFAHVNGLYDILATLRAQYPNLLIENVSGGGNRLDLGMLRYTDVAWMDDRTAPSVNVRHNLEGLSAVFPPAYLLSFVTDHDTEPLQGATDLSLYFRSRMAGALGLCFRSDSFDEGEMNSMAREIAIYRAMRDTMSVAAAALLTDQAAPAGGPQWDVLQETASATGQSLLCAYQSDSGSSSFNVKPTGLMDGATYEVTSVDTGGLGTATGADLMANGIDLVQSPNTAAHILLLRIP